MDALVSAVGFCVECVFSDTRLWQTRSKPKAVSVILQGSSLEEDINYKNCRLATWAPKTECIDFVSLPASVVGSPVIFICRSWEEGWEK